MITLKSYQQLALNALRDFLVGCAKGSAPDVVFDDVRRANGHPPVPYVPARPEAGGSRMPYVCLRVPTGGGKTLMACHAAGIAMDRYLQRDRAVILWLVPNTTILEQTVEALRDPAHAYRAALEAGCGPTEVLAIEDALQVPRATLESQTVVIVSTIQAFRIEDTTGRKVYAANGALMEHFSGLPPGSADLRMGAGGGPQPSLANVLRLRRPVVIVDEAHNARTDLSFSTLGGIKPACIIEFTATPAHQKSPSNVLHQVSAAELKAAEMVKLPVRVVTRHPSQRESLLADAIRMRADLEVIAGREAQETGEYLRPILLIQAERVDDCGPLRDRIVSDFLIPREHVRIAVGSKDELKGEADLSSKTSPIRVILTVRKLAEGWDCPFAYILCSLRENRSSTAIEQIVGRILRLPGAKAKSQPALNTAYVYSISERIADVLAELRDALVVNGFNPDEARQILVPIVQGTLPLGAQPETISIPPASIDVAGAAAVAHSLAGRVRIQAESGHVTILTPLSDTEVASLEGVVTTEEAKEVVRAAARTVAEADLAFGGSGTARALSPAQKGLQFEVPRLAVKEGQALIEFEAAHLLECPWRLSEKDASLAGYDPSARPGVGHGKLDVEAGRLVTLMEPADEEQFAREIQQASLSFGATPGWTESYLIGWLDRHIEHQDIPFAESAEFIRKAVNGVCAARGATVDDLARDRFRLRDALEARINLHRAQHRSEAFQTVLAMDSVTVADEYAVDFRKMSYEPHALYDGGYKFTKHYFGERPGDLQGTKKGGGIPEECSFAMKIDALPEVQFWVRNLARRPGSFSLQTSSDRFFPDFVCKLTDGRILVIEYKGVHLYDNADSREKRAVGAVWESRSGGRCLFLMPRGDDFSEVRRKIGLPTMWP